MTEYPAWLEGPMTQNIQDIFSFANQRMEEGYVPYTGERIAGFNQLQQDAIGRA